MASVRRRTLLAAQVRAHVPAAAIPPLHRLRLRQDLRNPRVLAQAREHMDFLVGAVRPEADLDALARGYLACMRWRIETRWHYEVHRPAVRVEGAEHLAAAHGGAVLNFLHHGPFERVGLSVAQHGHHLQMMMAPWFFDPDAAPWLRQHALISTRGCSGFSSAEGSAGVRARLEAGQLVAIASDMPGRTEVDFLGRRRLGSFGAARLAHETGRPVLVVTSHRDAAGAHFRVHAPLDPAEFANPRALLEQMLRLHEPAVLAWPEAYEEPRQRWGCPESVAPASST